MPSSHLSAAGSLSCILVIFGTILTAVPGKSASSGSNSVGGFYTTRWILEAGVDGKDIDGNGYRYNGTSASECRASCIQSGSCNLWSYCGRDGGCGRWCIISKEVGCYEESSASAPKNWCVIRRADGYYQFKNAKAVYADDPRSMVSGKIYERAPKKEKHPPEVSKEWKCSKPYVCRFTSERDCKNDKSTCPPSKCGTVRGLYDTPKIVVAETNSLIPGAGTPNHPPAVTSASACCSACSAVKGCNIWNYCWDPAGCGALGSCDSYFAKYPRKFPENPDEYPPRNPPGARGYYGDFCTSDGRFPRDFCILRQAGSDLKTLKPTGSRDFHSWTSGKLIKN